eukprot:Gregarina_sp_Poly_1__2692@NODE_173_length_12050_cov_429_537511_g154_i0_p3_GENE_NODE_173_length_12050_cov_429_537511_g154_i0NODE_173_length_12050_cov_429_537511_g154_i0_p3_ORF_typecomplete_len402_score54_94RNase_HII/PF01351_18/5_8e37_NODE_173_length_12050_cov_429_537511_g154_i06951900
MILSLKREVGLLQQGWDLIVGVDEAGRGPLAGPVCCGAFSFLCPASLELEEYPWNILTDSKQMTEQDRENVFDRLLELARGIRFGHSMEHLETQHKAVDETSDGTMKDIQHTAPSLAVAESTADHLGTTDDPESDSSKVVLDETQTDLYERETTMPSSLSTESTIAKVISLETQEVLSNSLEFIPCSPIIFALCKAEPPEIDILNILNATLVSMSRAVYNLIARLPNGCAERLRVRVLVDGNRIPPNLNYTTLPKENELGLTSEIWDLVCQRVQSITVETIIKGDSTILSIAAASVIAKVCRDRLLRVLSDSFPQYELAVHKGYPTLVHKRIVAEIGPSSIHRLSFEPCYSLLKSKKFSVPEGRDFDIVVKIKEAAKSTSKRRSSNASDASQPRLKLIRRK